MTQTIHSTMSKPASTESVTFTDGMLVTADDLGAAMRYPLSVVQVLLRAFFGCGIVCGLEIVDPLAEQRGSRGANVDGTPERGFVLRIERGVALGCDGYPIELCEELKLDLSPDPCACPISGVIRKYIAIRRVTATEAPPQDCGCDCGPGGAGGSGQQCTRLRDHILVQAFSLADLPKGICQQEESDRSGGPAAPAVEQNATQRLCACLKACPDCDRCAEPWVLIGTVRLDKDGIVLQNAINDPDGLPNGGRRYVKPIACVCSGETAQARGPAGRTDKPDTGPAKEAPDAGKAADAGAAGTDAKAADATKPDAEPPAESAAGTGPET